MTAPASLRALLLATVMVAGAWAGCLGAKDKDTGPVKTVGPPGVDLAKVLPRLSASIYPETIKEHVPVPSFDGKKLDAWVFRPKVPEGTQVPVFINFSPYWSNLSPSAESGGDAFSQYMIHEYVPRGYAVALTSVRGTGYSEGCFNLGGEVERKDAVAVIEAFAKQPWSSGSIAAGGKSYDGTTPQGAAIEAPQALKAIFPVSPISELYKYNYMGGVPYGQGPIFNTYYYAGVGMGVQYGDPLMSPALLADDVACPYLPDEQANGVGSGVTGDYTSYWTERNYTKGASKVKAAVFYVHGFTDWNVKPDNILPWLNAIDAPKKVWLHNWTRDMKPGGDGHVYPMRDDWNLTMLRFLDQTLKGIDTGIFDEPAFQIEDSTGAWRWESQWPPADVAPTRYFLSANGGKGILNPEAPGKPAARTFTDSGAGPAAGATSGDDFLRYESAPLSTDLHYAGVPLVHLQAASDRPVGKIVATLYDVAPNGGFELINWGGLNLRQRVSLEDPQPVMPGTTYDLQFQLFPQDDVVPAGHRLVLFLAGGGGQFLEVPYRSTITVQENAKAFLELPIQTGALQLEDPQPGPTPCWAC